MELFSEQFTHNESRYFGYLWSTSIGNYIQRQGVCTNLDTLIDEDEER